MIEERNESIDSIVKRTSSQKLEENPAKLGKVFFSFILSIKSLFSLLYDSMLNHNVAISDLTT